MNAQDVPSQTVLDEPAAGAWGPRLSRAALGFGRVAWLVIFAAASLLFLAAIPAYAAHLRAVNPGAPDIYGGQLNYEGLAALRASGISLDLYVAVLVAVKVLFVSVWLAAAAIIFWRKPGDRMALFASFTLVTFGVSFGYWIQQAMPAWGRLLLSLNFLSGLSIGIFLYIFPDGRFVPRWLAAPAIALDVGHEVLSTFFPALVAASPVLSAFENFNFLIGFLAVVVVQVHRYRRVSTPAQRRQTRWALYGFVVALAGFNAAILLGLGNAAAYVPGTRFYLAVSTLMFSSLLFIPLSIGVAILRAHLWDIDVVINRTLVYGTLTATTASVYVLVAGYLGSRFEGSGDLLGSLVAAALVAVAFQPLRAALQRAVNRLMYGLRDEPYAALAQLGERLQAGVEPGALLDAIVETVRDALKLPYVAIEVDEGGLAVLAAATGAPLPGPIVRLPLAYQREPVGALLVAPRGREEALAPADLGLIRRLADQIGLAVHAARLTADLKRMAADVQRSRERLVLAREEERRRLRRDLHDDLGPTLAALALEASNVRDLIPSDPGAAAVLADALQKDIRATVGDIRRLVNELRPPALDELGLVAAIRERAAQFRQVNVSQQEAGAAARLVVYVDAPPDLPPQPAAVEVAAYRIVQEALTNVSRHARAHTCTVRLALSKALEIEVLDDGIGLPERYQKGVGLDSMRERAAELGGSCSITRRDGAGTRVYARLPLSKE